MHQARPGTMASFWMPFTNNRDLKRDPRLLVSAKGMY
ncbi:adenosylmethionine-8-amino-7-oxononanoate aminotransferase [Massilia sp. MP_M2]